MTVSHTARSPPYQRHSKPKKRGNSTRLPVHLYYPAAVRAFERHDDPAGTRLPNVADPFLAPSLRAFHFPYNTTSSPSKVERRLL